MPTKFTVLAAAVAALSLSLVGCAPAGIGVAVEGGEGTCRQVFRAENSAEVAP